MTHSSLFLKTLLVAAAMALPMLAYAADPATVKDGRLVDHNEMTLYTFAKDADGKPLYTFIQDKRAGDMKGDGKMHGAWKVAKP